MLVSSKIVKADVREASATCNFRPRADIDKQQFSNIAISMSETPIYEIREDDHGIGKVFILRSAWNDDYASVMTKHGIEALRLPSLGYGFKAQPIDFIAELHFLRSIEVYTPGITDLTPVSKLENIEVLGLGLQKALGIEDWRPPLKVLLTRWCNQLLPLLSIGSLEYVNIHNYPYIDLQNLKTPNLRRLLLTSRKLESLTGVASFPKLEQVDLYNCPNLLSVDELKKNGAMKTLEVEACRHISSQREITRFDG